MEANKAELAAIQAQIQGMKNDIEELKLRQALDEADKRVEGRATLTPGEDGFHIVRLEIGVVTIDLEDVAAYANGSKVKISFGNTSAASLTTLSGKITWGQLNGEQKQKSFSLQQKLVAGQWTSIPFVLEGIPPAKIDFVRLEGLSTGGISLKK